ncbi:MAG: fuconate dehydratase [Hamadaea sp.]|uniref:enolase C-terminal domain-like protein n=1 Tax=Hamadaea sp. TaxID=2024425 RepID=UPI0017CD1B0C|nr:enolase C-terminal domain-like protein [Hamadaea sp.]NUR49087.1 fuconate dehydratase [Hamadaea sp.]NUR70826.1 fuconate dehydratase [Hamadaea sp.]NUT19932.1 fuconate dehydratase [Hamadaea sp.]
MKITGMRVHDVRFPTSKTLDGSDAMNPDPDYSAAYVELLTDDGLTGYGLTFTIGRGNDVCVAAIEAMRPYVVGQSVDDLDLGEFARRLTHDSQLRWLGPEKGVMHLAAAAVINAVWDLAARRAGLPLWRLLSAYQPDHLVDLIDWRYLTDALTPADAVDLLADRAAGREQRAAEIAATGYPAYTTSAGWLGYDDAKVTRLAKEAVADGFDMIKLKVGADLDDDLRRFRAARAAVGARVRIAVDANQRWGVPEAIDWMKRLASFDPYWIEEPTSPDEVLGHAAIRSGLRTAGPDGRPIRVATGEHVHNRVMFKQLLQADAIDVVQIDACRVGGVNENLAILLLAAAFGKPVCPHAGGVGLCELVQHLSFFDYVAVSGSLDGRHLEYVDHLHEHFVDPVVLRDGRYLAPEQPGFSAQMRPEALTRYAFPDGPEWRVQ